MENIETIIKNIDSAGRIAIALPKDVTVDLACAAVALAEGLKSRAGKAGNPSCYIFSAAEKFPSLPFLKNQPRVFSQLSNNGQMAIKVSNAHGQPSEIKYETDSGGLVIYIKSESGQIEESDVSVLSSPAGFDLVIILGAASFEQLGSLYTNLTKMFFETPNINIDVNPANEFYGTVNLVAATASSVSEVVMDVLTAAGASENTEVATALLGGIISQTNSFRDPKTSPATLLKSSRLISAGARQQEIIQHLFKTKPLPQLQLWGRALARLVAFPEKQALLTVVTSSDLTKTHADSEALPKALRDILEMITGYSLVALIAETSPTGAQVLVAGLPFEELGKFAQGMGVVGGGAGAGAAQTAGKPSPLVGKYEFMSFSVTGALAEVQAQVTKLIENRGSVV
jgi:bifunctional oligoribonuclease and PAP phosphatase NrnA